MPVDKKAFFQTALLALALAATSCNRNANSPVVSGTIETDEVHVASRYGGRVREINAQEGDALKPGQVIMALDADELQARRNEAAATLAELEAGARKEEIETARNDWQSQQAEAEFARADSQRAEELFQKNTISKTELDRAVSHSSVLEKSAAAAKSRYDLLLAGTRLERLAQARAQLEQIDSQLREMKISAPTNSVLEVLSVKVGDVLAPNREVATLILPQHLWVRVYVPEPWLGHIKLGEAVKVRVDSFPNRDFEGSVEQINRSAEFTPRNVQTVEERIKQVFGVKVRLKNEEDKLRSGMSADVVFSDTSGTP
ncbi:MAG: Secretion protein HlyD family protein [Pedosphaera sp.]|nr:Secretion protein HlyD family protein [Pedosphaera sp.]